jgi:hypothetical protein
MLPLALILLAASTIILALALRGRIIARGRFCRRCNFDLAGLDPATTPACPECGRDLAEPRATSPVVRRRSAAGLIAAALLALAAAVPLAATIPAARTQMLPHLPDPALAALDRLGLQGTHAETLARLQDTARPRSPALATLIDDALATVEKQPDQAPRPDLERIVSALNGDKLDEPQLTRLLGAMYTAEYGIRTAPMPGEVSVPFIIDMSEAFDLSDIGRSLGLPFPSRFEIRDEYHMEISHDADRTVWSRISGSFSRFGDWPTGTRLTGNWQSEIRWSELSRPDATTDPSIRWNRIIQITEKATSRVVATVHSTHAQEVRLSDRSEHGITLVNDENALAQLAESISISGVRVPDAPVTTGSLMTIDALFRIQAERPPTIAAAYRMFVLEADGARTPIGSFQFDNTTPTSQTVAYFGSQSRPTDHDAPTWNARFARWAAAGTVDILLVPDPWLAWESFLPDRLLAGELIIRDVPVGAAPPFTPGQMRPINPRVHRGQIFEPSPADDTGESRGAEGP